MYNDALREVEKATTAADLFDFSDPSGAAAKHKQLAALLHPDKNPATVAEATEAFAKLSSLWRQYREGDATTDAPIIISSRRRTYVVDRDPLYRGELANHYRARYNEDDQEISVLLKMPRDPRNSDLMQNEGFKLKQISTGGDERFTDYVPRHVESFRHRDAKDKSERLVNVLAFPDGLYSLDEVRSAYPNGVDPKDAAWMWRRILVVLGYIHGAGVIHGAIFPEHVLIQPEQHGLVLIDFCYATDPDEPVTTVSKRHYPHDYPEEVPAKEPANTTTDIFMATKCMTCILGDRVPRQMRAFAQGSAVKRMSARPTDAWELQHEFDDLIKHLWGERKFHPFHMPERKA